MLILKHATHLYIGHDEGGFYKVEINASVGFVLVPGSGSGRLVVNGVTFVVPIANPDAKTMDDNATALDLATALLAPVTVAHAGDDLSAVMAAAGPTGFVELPPGDYPAFHVPLS